MKDKINKLLNNKRTRYLLLVAVLFVFALILNITYSAFTQRNVNDVANIKVKDMEYSVSINGLATTIIEVPANDITRRNISIASLNSIDSKYELIYDVCSDSTCNEFITLPDSLAIEYSSRTIDPISDTINSGAIKSLRLILTNTSNNTYYIKVSLNAGYIHNTLALENDITNMYDEDDILIAAYIDGELSTTFPTTNGYTSLVTCTVNGNPANATGSASWNGTKWVLNITGADTGETRCNVSFAVKIPTLADYILGENNSNVSTPQTTPGRAISTSTEAVLASTPDDYGTSYYYRGAVENNYVSFANMCWRVVRVTGNGAIKLVLYNYNPNNVSNPCDSTQDGTTNAFARYSGDTYTTAFNANYNQNAYIGFMYGTAGSSSYGAEHANNNKSTILTNLEAWYNAKLSSYSSKLADTIWCNDKSTKSTYTVDGTAYGNGLGYSTNQTMYGARDRIYANNKEETGASPTLICANDNNGGKLSKFTADDVAYGNGALTYKIGLLTADEVAFAGGIYGNANSTYYLNKNASGNHWWSLSPYYFIGSYAREWYVNSTGSLDIDYVYVTYGLRPAVSLSSATTATGSGTQTDPWKIQS